MINQFNPEKDWGQGVDDPLQVWAAPAKKGEIMNSKKKKNKVIAVVVVLVLVLMLIIPFVQSIILGIQS